METKKEEEPIEQNNAQVAYLIFTFVVGISLVAALIYLGFIGYSFWLVATIGGLAQVIFRVAKRAWSNSLNPHMAMEKQHKNPWISGVVETLPTLTVFASLYTVMVLVSAFWYGVGAFSGWLFN